MIRINNTQYFHFLQQADALRRSGSLCDATISVKSQTFRAHRLVLACASRTLAQQLSQGDIDSPVHCTLEYFSPHTFQQVLDFTYTQALEVSADDLHHLLHAAQLLEMQPLEDQCRKQLDTLNYRHKQDDSIRENTDGKEPKESAKGRDHSQNRNLVQDEALQKATPSTEKDHSSPQSPRKKYRPSDMAATPCNRDSVISRPVSSSSSVSSPWSFPTTMWNSVSTLRRIAENYSNLIASHPLQSPNQTTVAYPFPFSTHHMFPLLPSPFQSHHTFICFLHVVVTDESCAGCRFCGRDACRCDPQSHRQDHRVEKPYQCQHCPKKFSLKHQLDTHHRVHTGEKPFECRLCGQRSRDYSAMIKHLRTHGGAAPYQCTICREYCSSLVAMQRHIKSHSVQDFPPDWSINSTYLYISHI
uniref:Zinc finger and BTB domain containing 32 n=1 Tax=Sphaeramia orbicularis TaxID=375764 RepID=A0A673ALI0_9TELE